MTTTVTVRSILENLGLPESFEAFSDECPAYRISWPGCSISVAQVTNKHLRPVWFFVGHYRNPRCQGMIDFEMPLEVESFEQGTAWMAENIIHQNHIAGAPDWLVNGIQWRSELPWVRRQVAHAARDRCTVDRVWFRLPCKAMKQWATDRNESDFAEFSFDGQVLRIVGNGEVLAMPAHGVAWQAPVRVAIGGLRYLPLRLMRGIAEISIWECRLHIERLALPLAHPPG